MTQNYEFLTSCGHNIPELTRIENFLASIQAWPQFDSYITTWRTDTALNQRTFASLQQYFLDQYGDMPGETAPRGGNAFHVKGKGKIKGKGKGKGKTDKGKGRGGQGQKRTHDGNPVSTSSEPSLSSFANSASNSSTRAWATGSSSNPVTSLTEPFMQGVNPIRQTLLVLLLPRLELHTQRSNLQEDASSFRHGQTARCQPYQHHTPR
jgi:hypothetical protein